MTTFELCLLIAVIGLVAWKILDIWILQTKGIHFKYKDELYGYIAADKKEMYFKLGEQSGLHGAYMTGGVKKGQATLTLHSDDNRTSVWLDPEGSLHFTYDVCDPVGVNKPNFSCVKLYMQNGQLMCYAYADKYELDAPVALLLQTLALHSHILANASEGD